MPSPRGIGGVEVERLVPKTLAVCAVAGLTQTNAFGTTRSTLGQAIRKVGMARRARRVFGAGRLVFKMGME